MRFAASPQITDFLKSSIDLGATAQAGAKHRSAIKNAATQLEGQVGASGVTAAGQVEAAGIIGAAQASAAQGQAMGSAMSSIGGIASSAIGAFGGGGGGGTDIGGFSLSDPVPGGYTYSGAPLKTTNMNFFGTK